MPKSLNDLERLLAGRGFPCRRVRDTTLAVELPTESYTNGNGGRTIKVRLSLDPEHGLLVIDTPGAFVLGETRHTEATLACLNAAAAETAFVRPHLDPRDGDVRFRLDCTLGKEGLDEESLLRMLSLIPQAADRWYSPIKTAVEQGCFEPAADTARPTEARLRSLARRAGGVNRVAALLRMNRRGLPEGGDPTAN